MKRVVIDTNALVAARFKPHGSSSQLMDLCVRGDIQALISAEIESENRSILKKVKPSPEYWKKLQEFYDSARLVTKPPVITVAEDPADDKYLACAIGGKAEYLISSDRHLLMHDGYQGIKICKSHEFFRSNPSLKTTSPPHRKRF